MQLEKLIIRWVIKIVVIWYNNSRVRWGDSAKFWQFGKHEKNKLKKYWLNKWVVESN